MVTQKESLDSLFQERGPDPWGYSSPHVLQRLEKSIAFIRRHVPSSFQGEFVELGAFNGAFSRHLRERFPAASLIVNDVADAAIAQARRNLAGLPRLQIVQADLAEMCPSTSQATRIILLLECLYYRAHEERAGVLRHLIMAFEQAPIFISGPITGGSYFTEPWLIEQFAAAGYELAVLGAEIKDQYALALGSEGGRGRHHGNAFGRELSFPTSFPSLSRIPVPPQRKRPRPCLACAGPGCTAGMREREKSIIPREPKTSKPT